MLIDFSKDPLTVARWGSRASLPLALEIIDNRNLSIDDRTREILLKHAQNTKTIDNPIGRASAYRVLGMFDADDREGIGVKDGLPDIDWVTIPDKGKWVYQDAKHKPLPEFKISRYPITYAQFQIFINASDVVDNRWWDGMPDEEEVYGTVYKTREFSEQNNKYWNHPRTHVSWYQAIAFCRWLSDKLGYTVDLPTEEQWERAARGTDRRTYPYGNEFDATKGNTSETGIGQTSVVGIFPDGASPDGVLDMSGNVWQWCLNKYNSPENIAVDASGETRVLRGGAFSYYQPSARASSRKPNVPSRRLNASGFRVVVSPVLKAVDR